MSRGIHTQKIEERDSAPTRVYVPVGAESRSAMPEPKIITRRHGNQYQPNNTTFNL